MHERVDYASVSPAGLEAMRALERHLQKSTVGRCLLELVKIRASLMNGCAHCIDMHTKVARAHGETEERINALGTWREALCFDERERAALAWTEAVTRIESAVPDGVYHSVRSHFDEAQLVDLTYAIVAINGWNRLVLAFRRLPGPISVPARANAHRPGPQ